MNARRTVHVATAAVVLISCEKSPTVLSSPRNAPADIPIGPASSDVLTASLSFTKVCNSPTNIGSPNTCQYQILNTGTNTLAITALSDIVHASGADAPSGNVLSFLQLRFSGTVSCTGGSGSGTNADPYVGATSCSLAAGASISTGLFSHYTVQAGDYALAGHLLTDDASLSWNDTCTPDPTGCSAATQVASASSSTTVQQLTATTTTTIHNSAHQAVVTAIAGGTAVHDFVNVAGPASSPTPTGTVIVDWFTNSTCTGTANASSSPTNLDAAGNVDVIGFVRTPTAGGSYAFQARYSGSATYAASTGPCEGLTVVDANIQISPLTGTNTVNTNHVLTGHVNINAGTGYVNAPDGTVISFNIVSGPGSLSPNSCTATGGTGSCTVTLTSAVAGTTTINASTAVVIAGTVVTRSTTGSDGNSAQATKTWVLPNPVLTVTKSCPNGKQSLSDRFAVRLNGTATGDVLDCGQSVNLTLQPSTAFNVTEGASGTTTNLANYSVTYSGCQGTGLAAGATSTCTITNTLQPPRSGALTPGYWKNHSAQTSALLPVSLGNYVVQNFAAATTVFNAMDCGASKDPGVIGCLAGQLLAAKLNVKNGSSNCVNSLIDQADAILIAAGYQGSNQPLGTPLTNAERQAAERLVTKLDRYNSGKGC